MILKKLWKYRRIFYTVGIIAIIFTLFAVRKSYRNTICNEINVIVLDSSEAKFVTQSTVISYLLKNVDYDIEGNYFKNIKLYEIEDLMKLNPYVKTVEVYRKGNNTLEIQITQRVPLVRVFDNKDYSYYIDNEGNILPLSKTYASYVPVFSGEIKHYDTITKAQNILNINSDLFDTTYLSNIYTLGTKMLNNEFINALIDQVYVLQNNELEMIPKVGDFKIIFGTTDSIETKFENIEAFYKEAGPKVGWNIYSEVNFKYTNQIVCTKK